MTLVELVVAMSIMSILLLGIGSALFVGYRAAGTWNERISQAETINQLAGALDRDVHVDVPCPWPSGTESLTLCKPGSDATGPAYSAVVAGSSWNIIRQAPGAKAVVLARRLAVAPQFFAQCSEASNVDTGYVGVRDLHYPAAPRAQGGSPTVTSPPPLVVWFRAPHGSCGGSGG
jgi:hypothetical protein